MRREEQSCTASRRHLAQSAIHIRFTRTSPCPCGSGKKYKKCCGKNK
ncbi:MAG: SEC-C metal-binding domain-containing protein [Clostridium fessum]